MKRHRWLVMRGHDALWAVRSDRVRSVEAGAAGVRVNLGHCVLTADGVLEAAAALTVTRRGAVARSVMPPGCIDLAMHPAGPVLVVDADAPPTALLAVAAASRGEEEEGDHGIRG